MSNEQKSSSSINNLSEDKMNASSMSSDSESSREFYYDETAGGKLARKAKDNPFFPIAMSGFTLAVLYGAYRFKYRGDMPISLYLIHLRVGAQGVAVGSLSIGMIYMLGKRLYDRFYKIENTNSSNSNRFS